MKIIKLTAENKLLQRKIGDVQNEIEVIEEIIKERQLKIAHLKGFIEANKKLLKKLKTIIKAQQV